jgi:hypothetical protein
LNAFLAVASVQNARYPPWEFSGPPLALLYTESPHLQFPLAKDGQRPLKLSKVRSSLTECFSADATSESTSPAAAGSTVV